MVLENSNFCPTMQLCNMGFFMSKGNIEFAYYIAVVIKTVFTFVVKIIKPADFYHFFDSLDFHYGEILICKLDA